MDAQPLWFGPADRRLFGWVHQPANGTARAAVVVCPSMGQEATFSHYTLRQVAESLAERGFLVVRFDYHGTGDSAGGHDDPDRVRAWRRSIDSAIGLAQDHTSAPVVLLGLRLGALLAATATQGRRDVHGLVLWDSPRSGRSYVREQRTRHNVSVGGAEKGAAAFGALGLSFTQETLDDLGRLNLRELKRLPCEVALSINRPGLTSTPDISTRCGESVTHLDAEDQDAFLLLETPPDETVTALLAWFDETYREPFPCSPTTEYDGDQRLHLRSGIERVVALGEHKLFGIVSDPRTPRSSTTVVFVPERYTPHTGQSRLWTDSARAWSELGVRTLRFDLSGCGDSDARPGVAGHQTFLVEHLDDILEAVRDVSPVDPSDVLLIGLCSGAYLSLETALALEPRGIALINPVTSFITPELPIDPRRQAMQLTRPAVSRPLGRIAGRLATRLSKPEYSPGLTLDPHFDWSRCLEAGYWRNFLNRRLPGLPELGWRLLNRLLLTRQTEDLLGEITDSGTNVLLVAGDSDWTKFTLGSGRALRRLVGRGRLQTEQLPELDHAMLRPVERDRVQRLLTDYVRRMLLSGRFPRRTPRATTWTEPVRLAG